MLTRPAFFLITKIKLVSGEGKSKNIIIPFPLFAVYILIEAFDDIIWLGTSFTIKKQNNLGTVTRIIRGCSVGIKTILEHLMLNGKFDFVNVEVGDGEAKVIVDVVLR